MVKLQYLFISLMALILISCTEENKPKKSTLSLKTASQPRASSPSLCVCHKKANISPAYVKEHSKPVCFHFVISPFNGTIEKIFFKEGDIAAKNQLLLSIVSDKLNDTLRNGLINYLNANRAYQMNQIDFNNVKILKKYGIISAIEYKDKLIKYQDTQFNLERAEAQLKRIINLQNLPPFPWYSINSQDEKTVNDLFMKSILRINIYSLYRGAIAIHGADLGSDLDSNLKTGAPVKAGTVLLLIGDSSKSSCKKCC